MNDCVTKCESDYQKAVIEIRYNLAKCNYRQYALSVELAAEQGLSAGHVKELSWCRDYWKRQVDTLAPIVDADIQDEASKAEFETAESIRLSRY